MRNFDRKAVLPSGVVRRCLPLAALSPKVDAVVADMVPMGAAVVVHNKRPARIAGTLGTTGATARWPSNHFCSKSKMAKCLHELVRG